LRATGSVIALPSAKSLSISGWKSSDFIQIARAHPIAVEHDRRVRVSAIERDSRVEISFQQRST